MLENLRLAVAAKHRIGFRLFALADSHREITEKALYWLERVSLADRRALKASELPHGDQRKLEVGLLLALEPKIFMFDEPTAGMSVDEAAEVMGMSPATLKRRWSLARAWLFRELSQ